MHMPCVVHTLHIVYIYMFKLSVVYMYIVHVCTIMVGQYIGIHVYTTCTCTLYRCTCMNTCQSKK